MQTFLSLAASTAVLFGSVSFYQLRAAITDVLVVHLTFDDTLNDSSGRNNHGTAVGTVPFTAGKVGARAP